MYIRNHILSVCKHLFLGSLMLITGAFTAPAQEKQDTSAFPKEEDFYKIQNVPIPEGIELEVGGLAMLPNDKLAVCTRRGEVWVISNTYMKDGLPPQYKLFAQGLHEPLGIAYYKGDLYLAQRPELTRLRDLDGDGVADEYKTIYSFHISGNYHEYAYGPVFDKEGNMVVTLNLGWFGDHMESAVPWRGWMLKITPDGKMTPFAAGFRSPAGFTIDKDDNIFYTENQGRWVGSGHMTEVKKGDVLSHPASLRWSGLPGSPVKLKVEDIPDLGKPEFEVAKNIPGLKTPSIWIPHAIMGISTSGILIDYDGNMGPFQGQFFVGDQGQSVVNRLFLEKVKGVYQGAAFPFLKGFSSGVLRLCWGSDGSMFVGMTARGWGSAGGAPYGLQRVVWNGKIPFEIKAIRAMPDGFELEFTQPVDEKTARDAASYHLSSFTYKYHSTYGSPIINQQDCPLKAIEVSADHLKVRLVADSIREGYIHEIMAAGVRSAKQSGLLHSVGYYTLNKIPDGQKLVITAENMVKKITPSETETTGASAGSASGASKGTTGKVAASHTGTAKAPSFEEVKPLLQKYTCLSCHNPTQRQVGPPYTEIAKRKYSIDKIIDLIHNPQPADWPDYATPMPPIANITQTDIRKIAVWINSLDK